MSPSPPVDPDHFEAVLFDLDGVLTATAKVHAASWKLPEEDNFGHMAPRAPVADFGRGGLALYLLVSINGL